MSTKPEMPSSADLCSAIQTALQTTLGLPGPSLVLHLRSLLTDHQDWFRKQHCQDIFAKNLGIDVLHQAEDRTGSAEVEGSRVLNLQGSEEANPDGSRPSGPLMAVGLLISCIWVLIVAYGVYLVGCVIQVLCWVIPGCVQLDCDVLHPKRRRWPGVGGEYFGLSVLILQLLVIVCSGSVIN